MKLKFKKGNLLELFDKGNFDCIAHQCNTLLASEVCGGIAKYIFGKYKEACFSNNKALEYYSDKTMLLGKISGLSSVNKVYNLYSQYRPGIPTTGIDSMHCRIGYLKECLGRVKNDMRIEGFISIGIPLIASGLAKQKHFENTPDLIYFKRFILPVIKDVFKNTDIEITVVYLK